MHFVASLNVWMIICLWILSFDKLINRYFYQRSLINPRKEKPMCTVVNSFEDFSPLTYIIVIYIQIDRNYIKISYFGINIKSM